MHAPDLPGGDLARPIQEVEAESVAYLVGDHLGLDTTAYSVPYVAHWAGGDHRRVLEQADRVVGAARRLTTRLDRQLGVGLAPDGGTAPVIDLRARLAAISGRPEPPPLSVA